MKKFLSIFIAACMVFSFAGMFNASIAMASNPTGTQNGMSITQPANGSTVTTTSLSVSGTFDSAQPAGYNVVLTVTANSQSHDYTYTLPNTQSTWGPIAVPASDFGLATDGSQSYSTKLEATLQDNNGMPVPGIDTGEVDITWKPDAGSSPQGGELRIALSEEPKTLFSCLDSSMTMSEILGAIESKMVGEKPDGTLYPDMLTEVPSTDNGDIVLNNDGTMTVTYKLKHNLKWSDGEPVTSYDVKFSWEMMMNSEVQVVSTDPIDKITSIDTPDDYTVVTHWKEQSILARFGFKVYPSHILEPIYNNNPADINTCAFNTHPVYAGPYMLDKWVKGRYITVVKNPNYWNASNMPNIDRITFMFYPDTNNLLNALESGKVDMYMSDEAEGGLLSISQAETLEKNYSDRFVVDYIPSIYWEHLTLNMDDPIIGNSDDPTLRQALMYALDRQGMINQVFDGKRTICNEPINPQFSVYVGDSNINLYPYDPDKAHSMLQNAGYTWDADGNLINPNGEKVVINIEYYANSTVRENEVNFMKAQWWDNLGVTVNPVPKSWGSMIDDWVHGNFQAALFAWGSDLYDICFYYIYNSSQIPTEQNGWSGQNFTRFRNSDVDAATNECNSTIDETTRINDSHIIQQKVNQYLPELYLNWYTAVSVRPLMLKGFDYPVSDDVPETWNCAEWYFSQSPPSTPSNLQVTKNSDGSVTLTWNASTPGDEGHVYYNIYKGNAPGEESLTPINTSPITGTSFTDTNATGCFVYRVQAIDGNVLPLRSDYSNEVTVINGPPSVPSLVSPANNTVVNTNSITLQWNGVFGASSYNVQISDKNDFSNVVLNESVTNTSYSVPSGTLSPAKTYYWRVNSQNSYGTSGWSEIWTFITNDAYEPDDDSSHATLISTDGTIQTHNFGTQGDVDWLKFTAEGGKTYTIQTLNLGSNCDTVMYLYAPDGTTLIDYSDWFDGPASRIDFECPIGKGGTYYIKIKHWNSNAFGADTNYDIHVYPAIKISFSDSDNGNKEFGIAGQDNHVTVTVTQDGNPVSGASVYCGFTGTTQTTNTNGQVTLNVNPSWDGNVYFKVTKGDYAYCYRYFWLLDSNDSLIEVKPKNANGYYLTNYRLKANSSNEGGWSIYSSYHNTTYVMTWSNNSVVEVVKSDWDSGDDIAYYMVKSATTTPGAITNVPFDVSSDTTLCTITGEIDGQPLTNTRIRMRNEDFDYTSRYTLGWVDGNGSQKLYVTPGTYTVLFLRNTYSGDNTPALVLLDKHISISQSTNNYTLNHESSHLGKLNIHAVDGSGNTVGICSINGIVDSCDAYLWMAGSTEILLTPEVYHWDYEESTVYDQSGRWYYDFLPTETTTISAGETQEIDFGGPLTANINFDKSSYNPGDNVNIKVPITDHYGHYLDWVSHYSSSSGGASPGSGNYGSFHSPHKVNNPYYPNNNLNDNVPEQKLHKNEVNARIISPNYVQPSSWEYPYIYLTVKDPSNATVVDTSNYSFWYLRERGYNYTLPSNAPTGTYTVTVTLDTGPYQGTVTKEDTFTVSSSTSLTIHLKGNKFNLVSFPFTVNPSDIPNLVKAYTFDWSNYWQVWTPNGEQDFTTFEPGKGYWIKVSEDEDVTLTGTPAGTSNSNVNPSGIQSGMSITSPSPNSTVFGSSLSVSGTFDSAQPAGYNVVLTVTANSQSHDYTYTLPNTQSTWGPITVPASDFGLTTGNSYTATAEAILQDTSGIPVTGFDTGEVNFTWKLSSSFPVTITPGKFNLLGVPFNSSIDISALNSANGNHILKIYSFDWSNYWQVWTPNGDQDFTTLEPGKGYWILFDSSAPTTFTFMLP